MNNLKTKLQQIKRENRYNNRLKYYVANYIIDDYKTNEEIKGFFKDILSHGCSSGMIGTLIYYTDTHKFFKKYADDINNLVQEYKDSTGEDILKNDKCGDIQNFLAWFGFEQTCYNLFNELDLE